MRFRPATGVAVAVMTNTSVARAIGAPLGAIAERLAAIAGAAAPPSCRAAAPPSRRAEAFAGGGVPAARRTRTDTPHLDDTVL
jgi:hypothetical protein